jgi:hypothetical protein
MVLEVRHVIAHEVIERRRRVFRYRLPGELVQVVYPARPHSYRFRRFRHHSRDVSIECCPEFDELSPGSTLVPLSFDPGVLFVAGEDEVVLKLRAHESLMVIRGRVDQVHEMCDVVLHGT